MYFRMYLQCKQTSAEMITDTNGDDASCFVFVSIFHAANQCLTIIIGNIILFFVLVNQKDDINEAEKNGFVLWFYNAFCLLKAVNQCDCD